MRRDRNGAWGVMFGQLMTSRRFAPLFWCQFLSAFNDDLVRQMLIMLILFRFGGDNAGSEVALATATLVLPFVVLSAMGGELADSNDKALIARRLKFAEILVQAIAAAGFVFSSLTLRFSDLASSPRFLARSNSAFCPTTCGGRNWCPATRSSKARPSRRSLAG